MHQMFLRHCYWWVRVVVVLVNHHFFEMVFTRVVSRTANLPWVYFGGGKSLLNGFFFWTESVFCHRRPVCHVAASYRDQMIAYNSKPVCHFREATGWRRWMGAMIHQNKPIWQIIAIFLVSCFVSEIKKRYKMIKSNRFWRSVFSFGYAWTGCFGLKSHPMVFHTKEHPTRAQLCAVDDTCSICLERYDSRSNPAIAGSRSIDLLWPLCVFFFVETIFVSWFSTKFFLKAKGTLPTGRGGPAQQLASFSPAPGPPPLLPPTSLW